MTHVALSQTELAIRAGWARGDGRISRYLSDLGDVVVSRTDGLWFDVERLEVLERDHLVSPRAAQVAEVLESRFGRAGPDGTVVLAVEDPGGPRAPTLAEMAEVVGLARSTTHRHLRALELAGRLRRLDPTPESPGGDGPIGVDLVRYLLDRTESLAAELAEAHHVARALIAEAAQRSTSGSPGSPGSGATVTTLAGGRGREHGER